jgi:hypothetical protein
MISMSDTVQSASDVSHDCPSSEPELARRGERVRVVSVIGCLRAR